jgi:flagellar hook-associated protein 1 FlgK
MGARTTAVTRTNNPFLEKQIMQEGAELGYADSRSNALSRVEQVYNEQVNRGLNKFVADFFNSFRELASNPENLANRTLVKESALNLAKDFARVSEQLKGIQEDIDQQLRAEVKTVNQITAEIANLNEKVQSVEITGATANDERDRRDLLLKQLAEKIPVKWAEGDSGAVTVSAGSSTLLVSGNDSMELLVQEVLNPSDRKGITTRVMYKVKDTLAPTDVTDQITKGSMGGVLEVRDRVIEGLLANMDDMAYQLANKVNAVHRQGYNRFNEKGLDLFVIESGSAFNAASSLSLNKSISAEVGRIATAAIPDSPGDNRVANVIAQLQFKEFMGDGDSTVDEFYNGLVGKVGVTAEQSNIRRDSQKNIVSQLKNLRESISGVSLDEETTKMIEFQKAFDASAKLITTADELLDTVMSLKR